MSTATTGTGTITLGSAIADAAKGYYRTFATAGIADGDVVHYLIIEGSTWELGSGTYTSSGTTLSRTLIASSSGSLISLAGAADVSIVPLATDWSMVSGKGSDVASAGTLTLGDNSYYHVTDTTTITDIDFTKAYDGRMVTLIFDGVLTLTHNATTLKLPGGASITTAAGDRAIFIQDNGDNMTCIAYIRAASIQLFSNVEDQTITGGGRVTPKDLGNLSGASITPDPGDRSIQKVTNNGAGSILPGSNEGHYILQVLNTTGAGAITTTGWTLLGDAFDTTTTSKFLCSGLVTSDLKVLTVLKVA